MACLNKVKVYYKEMKERRKENAKFTNVLWSDHYSI